MKKDERGSILVEFIGSFLLFVLLIISILSLVNIITLQARMHYALTQTANTLSMYGYVMNVVGIDKFAMGLNEDVNVVQSGVNKSVDEINEVLGDINAINLPGIVKGGGTAIETFVGWGSSAVENPKGTLQLMASYALGEATNAMFGEIVKPLVVHYLGNGDMSGEEFLKSMGVTGDLQFYEFSLPGYTPATEGEIVGSLTGIAPDDSVLLDENGNVIITVRYKIDYSFMGLPLPFDEPTLSVTQSVMTKMWLGGEGDGYED